MSKYNVGDKFVVEIDETFFSEVFPPDSYSEELFRIKGFKSLVFDEFGLDKLERYIEGIDDTVDIEEIIKEAYKSGMNEAWDIAKKICLCEDEIALSSDDFYEVFKDYKDYEDVMTKLSPQEAKAKIEAWEKEQEEKDKIHVGDVLQCLDNKQLCIVTRIVEEYGHINVVWSDGSSGFNKIDSFKKTGKHVDLSKIFALVGDGNG